MITDLPTLRTSIKYEYAYRILDTKFNTWYKSNSRSIWLTLSGCKCALGHAKNNASPNYLDRFQIIKFQLVPTEE